MKLYSFKYSDYGSSYHVMSDSKENAIKAIYNYTGEKEWENATPDKLPSEYWGGDLGYGDFHAGYDIIEYDIDEVIETERS